jgi:hypothetical protein
VKTLEDLAEVVAEMRRLGVTKLRAEGLELELGPEPGPVTPPVPELTAEELQAKRREQHDRTLFAATGFRPVRRA